MGFFDFLAFLVDKLIFVLLIVLIIIVLRALFFEWQRYQAQLSQERYFESQKQNIIEAMNILDVARKKIPSLVYKTACLPDNAFDIFGIGAQIESWGMENMMISNFEIVIAGCRMRFGDYVTRVALLNLGMDKFVYGE